MDTRLQRLLSVGQLALCAAECLVLWSLIFDWPLTGLISSEKALLAVMAVNVSLILVSLMLPYRTYRRYRKASAAKGRGAYSRDI